MKGPKIHLSSAETQLMTNAEIILTKNSILQKMRGLLEEVQQNQLDFVKNSSLHNDPFTISPKISKGENYQGLPYIILDYPRQSVAKDFFFIRTMFWWGNFFSSTMQAGGSAKKNIAGNLKSNLPVLGPKDYYIGVNNDPWLHHFEKDNYLPLRFLNSMEWDTYQCMDYIKIAAKWPLTDWPFAAANLYESWKFLLTVSGLIT